MNLNGSWEYIESIARSRLANNKTSRHIDLYGDELEIMGAAGELAARRFLGLDEDLHTGFDRGTDLVFNRKSFDVKTTKLTKHLNHRYLQWPTWKHLHADIILLMAVDTNNKIATPVGWAWRDEVVGAKINRERPVACYEVPIPALHPLYELFQMMEGGQVAKTIS